MKKNERVNEGTVQRLSLESNINEKVSKFKLDTNQKTSLQLEHSKGKKSRRLHEDTLQCFPIESKSASSAMTELFSC